MQTKRYPTVSTTSFLRKGAMSIPIPVPLYKIPRSKGKLGGSGAGTLSGKVPLFPDSSSPQIKTVVNVSHLPSPLVEEIEISM